MLKQASAVDNLDLWRLDLIQTVPTTFIRNHPLVRPFLGYHEIDVDRLAGILNSSNIDEL